MRYQSKKETENWFPCSGIGDLFTGLSISLCLTLPVVPRILHARQYIPKGRGETVFLPFFVSPGPNFNVSTHEFVLPTRDSRVLLG